MQGTQYPTCNLVMPQLYQMITKLEMSSITYVHTARKETITIQESCQSRHDETHSEGEDSDGGEYV